ncbi:MAG: cob(I)yrinic acid a,c-diamide adenosyltransferase [Desulfobacterales bacterium]|jgi:cob(I)alamin adenosyltransferase|nr:cob(I)yrinic acid a,c-diamide adenosyltransferase [Desulfobacteraceae bacterium]MDD3990550.1 cob(I)yrinic acid a,c-diamide adenosyltransferase [Desulfobacteraceae bacterium]MDY0311921.1 cob(I)yrinic acid a,c-diamide adenosyltransferase [Desulfobacterales bacterium]
MPLPKGFVQVYTGDGKGKTTAVIGLAVRAIGAGLRVYLAQFLKQGDYSEVKALGQFKDRITIVQFGTGSFVRGKPSDTDRALAAKGLAAARQALTSGDYDVVILDEANVAATLGLISTEAILELVKRKPETVELVISGRGADPAIIAAADLVTEVKVIKHYYENGVQARTGIEK